MATTNTKTNTKTKTTAKNATKANTTRRTSSAKTRTQVRERDPKVIVVDSLYATAGLAADSVTFARTLPERLQELSTRDALERTLEQRRKELEQRVTTFRDRAEKRFDEKATIGRTIVDDVVGTAQFRRVFDQAKTARSQVKAAVTSIRKTAGATIDAGVQAGRKQADTAKSQTKAAVTSLQKTAGAAVDASR